MNCYCRDVEQFIEHIRDMDNRTHRIFVLMLNDGEERGVSRIIDAILRYKSIHEVTIKMEHDHAFFFVRPAL